MQTQTSNTLHNPIMEAGSKDRPPMLASANYAQWKSRIKRYIDTKPNHELIHHCLKNPPYKFTWADKEVPISKGSPVIRTESYMETYKTVSQDIRDQLNAEAEVVQIILTGIDNDIYSTVDAYPNACDMWKAIERSQQAATRNRGKAIVNSSQPIYDQEPSMVAKDDETSKDKEIDKLMALISLSSTGYENQRIGNVAGARETVGSTVVQKSGIQCYNCKEFRHVTRECHKPKRVKDAAYHGEKMLLCKQEEAGIQLNAKQADWRDDTDDELEDQELEAHYMYMAKLQEVSPDAVDYGPIFDAEPLQKVSTANHYNVFAIKSEHPEQSKSIHDTYPIEQDEHNVIIDSLDMSYDREQIDQNDDDNDLANERELLASLIAKLKCEIDDNKNRNKFLETSNKGLIEKLRGEIEDFKNKNKSLESSNNRFKEGNNKLSETNNLLYNDFKKSQAELARRNDVEYASKVEIDCVKARGDLISYKMKSQKSFNKYTQTIIDLNQTISEMKNKLSAHQETISILLQQKEAQIKLYKTHEDKELDKVIALENKVKFLDNIVYKTGQSIQMMNMLNNKCRTSFAKPEFLKKAQRANPRLYDIDEVTNLQCDYLELLEKCECLENELSKSKPTIFLDSLERKDFSKSKSVTQNNVSNDLSKPVTTQTLPPNQKSILKNTNMLAPGMYKLHTEPTQTRTSQLPQDSRKTNKRVSFSTGVIPTTSVSRPQLKSNPMGDTVMRNNSQGMKQDVEDHRRSVKFSKNKTPVNACNDILKAKTLNVNFVCATCGSYHRVVSFCGHQYLPTEVIRDLFLVRVDQERIVKRVPTSSHRVLLLQSREMKLHKLFQLAHDVHTCRMIPRLVIILEGDMCTSGNVVTNSRVTPSWREMGELFGISKKLNMSQMISKDMLIDFYQIVLWIYMAILQKDRPTTISQGVKRLTTPDLPTEKPNNSLSMGDEHLSNISKTESGEVIKSSVKDLIPILSESEGISSDTCDVPFCDNSPPLDVLNDHFELFSDINDDCTSSDDDSFENIDYVEASPLDSELVSLEEVKDDILRKKLLNINLLIAKIESLNDNPTPNCVLKSPSLFPIPVEDSDSFSEKFDTSLSYSNNSLPEFNTFSDHLEKQVVEGELTSVVMEEPHVHVPNVLPTHPTLMLDSDFILSNDSFGSDLEVMAAPTIPISAKENLRDSIDIRLDIIHPEPVVIVAFLAAAVVRTQAQHEEAIRGMQEKLLGVPIQEELTTLRFRVDIAKSENASLRARIKTTEAIEKITRSQERRARMEMERQLALV
uniref:CCHC-type domain-containing protein n=1 Tax=Tanacetum cinerariifolium TaxID=118510 RepID=A0A699H7T8_TANCI|nr:hypothetical protein [Tanacetum cinerariifolium]